MQLPTLETLAVTRPHPFVVQVELNRPKRMNAMNGKMFRELAVCFDALNSDPDCRAIVFSAAGKVFTAGLDLQDSGLGSGGSGKMDVSRRAFALWREVRVAQDGPSALELCQKPVIAAMHGACIGGGCDLASACDIRYCSSDAWFSIKEVDVGLAADVGTLQRFPKVVGNDSLVRELVYTGRRFEAEEAASLGLVSRILPTREATVDAAMQTAITIASKSPVAVQGSKVNMNYSRDHTTQEGLDFIRAWNMAMLQSSDLGESIKAFVSKGKVPAEYAKL